MQDFQLSIKGMSCGGCVSSVQRALAGIANVEVVNVEIGKASLRADPEHQAAAIQAIEDAGFDVTART
jgi:copper chaperone